MANKRQRTGFCPPLLSPREAATATVPFSEVESGALLAALEKRGFAIVTDVVPAGCLEELRELFEQDLASLLIDDGDGAWDTPRTQCQGVTKKGQRCRIFSDSEGHLRRHAKPLLDGQPFCALHGSAGPREVTPSIRASLAAAPVFGLSSLEQWTPEACALLGQNGRCSERGLPHGLFAWGCRGLINVKRCFEALHGTEDLVVSLDVPFFSSFREPPATSNRSWPSGVGTIHPPPKIGKRLVGRGGER